MPKISHEHRELRRTQILEAAWRCFQREGVQATRIEHILAESGMAPSALYRYFHNKDDIIQAAIASSLQGLSQVLEPLVEGDDSQEPAQLIAEISRAVRAFSQRSGYNLMSIAVHGWSEAQRNAEVRTLMAGYYAAFRDRLADKARRWQKAGVLHADARPADVAQALMSLILGDVVQTTVVGVADPAGTARGVGMLRA